MKTSGRVALGAIVTVAVIGWLLQLSPLAQSGSWTPPKTPWGDPDLQGIYTNKDEANTPLERPDEFKGRDAETFSAADLARLAKERQALAAKIAGGIGGAETGAGPTHWYEHLQGGASRPWLIVDPADGKLPAMTPLGLKREAAWAALHNARNGEGRADSWLDRSLYDRCITRGLPGSMMPAIYGNSYEITQSPGVVAIRYEMIHEARIIPLEPSALREPQGRPERSLVGRGLQAPPLFGGNFYPPETACRMVMTSPSCSSGSAASSHRVFTSLTKHNTCGRNLPDSSTRCTRRPGTCAYASSSASPSVRPSTASDPCPRTFRRSDGSSSVTRADIDAILALRANFATSPALSVDERDVCVAITPPRRRRRSTRAGVGTAATARSRRRRR
jgi:hypothetical protein